MRADARENDDAYRYFVGQLDKIVIYVTK